ncbi:MAG: Gfo/Idh/MocA family protein, partial [Candidatus Hermodarchaeota archaeon]
MFKVGFIGTGVIFDLNVLGYLNNDDVEIVALCNRTIQKAKNKITEFDLNNDISIYSDYKDMLKKEELDIVEILLPHHLHAEATIAAANSGVRGISVQKPIALTLEEGNSMILACKESDTLLSIYENFLFAPHIMKAIELINEDYIGDPTSIRLKVAMGTKGGWQISESARVWRRDPIRVGGAQSGSPILLDNGWHMFVLAQWMFGEEIEKVFAWTDKFEGMDAPSYVIFKYKQSKEHVVPQYGHMEFSIMPEAI